MKNLILLIVGIITITPIAYSADAQWSKKQFAGDYCSSTKDCFGNLICGTDQKCSPPNNSNNDEHSTPTDSKATKKPLARNKTTRQKSGGACKSSLDCPEKLLCSYNHVCTEVYIPENKPKPKDEPDQNFARFRANHKENTIFLWVSPIENKNCPNWGNGYAEERANILNEWKTIRYLCYRVNEKSRTVEFKDPEKSFLFNTFSIGANNFLQIKWPSEIQSEWLERSNEEYYKQREEENKRVNSQPIYVPQPQRQITCFTYGQFTTCN